MASLYLLDASACGLLSEDWGLCSTRFHIQRELIACHSRACLADPAARPSELPAAERQVALIASSGGRAAVVLHPSGEAAALQQALASVQPGGEANLEGALKLALLVSRRFPAGSAHVTALVASAGALASLASGGADSAAQLRQRFQEGGVALDVAVLCPAAELGRAGAEALEALAGSAPSGDCKAPPGSEPACRAPRLVWLTPVGDAVESWQQLEPALELLEGRPGSAASPARTSDAAAGPPRRAIRAPRPAMPLLAARSGLQQPAVCRGESLSRLGHLSSDGMARPWLPTYSSLAQQAHAAAAAGAAPVFVGGSRGSSGGGGVVFVEVQPVPKLRTLLAVRAGRMAPPRGEGFADASTKLLRSLEALSVLDEREDGGGEEEQEGGGGSSSAGAARWLPDARRGTLRLLQATKQPDQLHLVWSPDREPSAGASAGPAPLDMFGEAAPSGSEAHSALLSFMPASAVAASASRGPLLRGDCELWEAAAEWEWELPLQLAASPGEPGSPGVVAAASAPLEACAPAAFEGRQLPNGAQLLLVLPTAARLRRRPPRATAFWLQQHVAPGSLCPPTYGTPAASTANPDAQAPPEQPDEHAGAAEVVAAALAALLRGPPAVDLRTLRRDVKSGAIPVTPITVGPLPASFVRDIVATRSALMGGAGVENLDSWGDEEEGEASEGVPAAAPGDAAAPGSSLAGGGATRVAAAAVAARQHKSAMLSLLRQRLHRTSSGKPAPPTAGEQPAASQDGAAADASSSTPAGSAGSAGATGPIPCTPPAAPRPAAAAADSCASSATGTPYGTPLHILPSRLLHHRGLEAAAAAAGAGEADPDTHTAAAGQHDDLPAADVKHGGAPQLLSAGGQGEGGDGEQPLFQLE